MFPVVVSQGFAGGNYFWRNNFNMYDVVLTIGPIPPVRPAPPAPAPIGFGLNLLRDVWLQVLTISNACVDCWPPLRSRAQVFSFWEYWQRGAVAGPGGLTRIVPIAFGGLGVTLDIYGYGTDFHAANYRTNPPPAPPAVPCTCGEVRSIFSWANSAVLTFGAPPLLGMFPYGIPGLPGPPGPARLNPGLPRVLGLPLPWGGVLPWGFTVSCGPGCGTLAIPCVRLTRWGFLGA
jgi:hypothetical protein